MIKEVLRNTILFSSFDKETLDKIEEMSTIVHLQSENVLFQQGQDSESFYYVMSGLVKLSRLSEDGDEKVIEIIRPGNFFAEALLFLRASKYPVQATAMTDAELVAIDSHKYNCVLKQSNDVMFKLLGAMSKRVHQLVSDIESLTLYSTKSRLAHYLLQNAENNQSLVFSFDLPKNTIASRLSMKPETFSRALHFFEEANLIMIKNKTVQIVDKAALTLFIHQEKI